MKAIALTEAEWAVMNCLWDDSPCSGRQVVCCMQDKMGWSRSTTLTLLKRLEEKGAVGSESPGSIKQFRPLITREEVAVHETQSLLNRAYQGSISLMVSSLTKKQQLSHREVEELYAILDQLEEK